MQIHSQRTRARVPLILAAVFLVSGVEAHHGAVTNGGLYFTDEMIVLEGEITEVLWRNPHTRARMTVTNDAGEEEVWELELGPSPRTFENLGLSADDFTGKSTVAGYRSRRNTESLGVLNVLLPSGEEYYARSWEARWPDAPRAGNPRDLDPAKVAAARESAIGIFRVWSGRLRGRPQTSEYEHLLTDRGREIFESFNPVTDNPELECRTGMATSMMDPVPMEITDNGDHIMIHLYEFDVRRTVWMDDNAPEPAPATLGYSKGRWEGDTLVVTTTHIDWPYVDPYGTPQSDQVEYLEKFSLSDDETMLNYSLTATDPVMYTAPITMERPRRWTPGVEIPPFNCIAEWEEGAV